MYVSHDICAGVEDYLQPFDKDDLQYARSYTTPPDSPVSLEFLEAADIVMRENNLEFPLTVEEAFVFYLSLNDLLHTII